MTVDKLKPSDPRATEHTATVRGKAYHYRLAEPAGRMPTGTILLVHGFPDLGFGWRNQVPMLAEELGLRVIVPDMLGYGQTDAPEEVALYSYKSVCDDLVALVDAVGVVGDGEERRFFVGGHDWGGAVTWRMALWYGARLRGVFSVCTPYIPPSALPACRPLTEIVQALPNFRYQLQFAGDEFWRAVEGDAAQTRGFLSSLYGGRSQRDGQRIFSTAAGMDLARLAEKDVGPSPLLSADEMDYYVAEYMRHGLRGPTNWYRTTEVNYATERPLVDAEGRTAPITLPALMMVATDDAALPSSMAAKMDSQFTALTKVTVAGTHWLLWQAAEEVNDHVRRFLGPLLAGKAAM